MFSLINRGQYDQAVESEFENLFARLRGLLSQTFDPDGNLIVADPNLAVVPLGAVMPFAGSSAPTGYLICDGSQVSRLTYKSLFEVIGTTYGTGDGSTTFHLPDLRQRFPLGKAASGTGNTLGATGGAIDHTHSVGSHTHTVSGSTSGNGGHSHSVSVSGSTGSDGSHTHGFFASTSVESGFDTQAGTGADRTTTHQHTVTGTTDAGGTHSHSVSASGSTDSVSDHTHSFSATTDDASGSTGAANPPYQVVNYIIFAGI
jgi:microcystin-dependent protein